MTGALRVLLADDHPLARFGARNALESGGFVVCGEAADADEAVATALEERPDVCLLDIRMPGGGIHAAAAIAADLPECAIVMLTVSRSDADLFDALRAGAVGYLLKDIDPERLPLALRGVLEGEAVLPRHLVALLVDEFRQRSRHNRLRLVRRNGDGLTLREEDVLELMQSGLSTGEIAESLGVPRAIVKADRAAILRKLRTSDRKGVTRLYDE
jgi:DNA-binding NarL/FixJ family response regulator